MTDRFDVAYRTANGRSLQLDVFAAAGESQRTAVLLLHGGAWRSGNKGVMATQAEALREHGFTCIPVEYRLTGESPWPAQVHDVKAAVRWVRSHAVELEIEPDRVAIQGFSAGGHLALIAAGTADSSLLDDESSVVSSRIDAVVAMFPPTEFRVGGPMEPGVWPPTTLLGENATPEEAHKASPMTYVSPDFPPTFFLHGDLDQVVDVHASLRMCEALRDAGVETDLHVYAGQTHEFSAVPSFRDAVQTEVAFFLCRVLSQREQIEAELITGSGFARRLRGLA